MGDSRRFLACITSVLGTAAVLGMAGPAAASGAVRHATVSGSGTTCSEADPCDVQTAVESASATDQVVVHPGTYTSNNDPLEVPDDVSVGSVAGQSRPRLVFTGSADAVTLGNGSSIARMAIESDGSGSALVGAPLSGGGTAERLIVHSTGETACPPRNSLLRDSVCWSSGDGGFAIRAASDTNAQTVTLRNVTADATSVDGTGLQVSAITGGSITVNAVNVIVDG